MILEHIFGGVLRGFEVIQGFWGYFGYFGALWHFGDIWGNSGNGSFWGTASSVLSSGLAGALVLMFATFSAVQMMIL